MRTVVDPEVRYLAKFDQGAPNECWPWKRGCFDSGYGAFRLGQKLLKAHRYGWERVHGPIPPGQYVLHRCDNPPCQNPGHWFLGTHGDNAKDRNQKNRQVQGTRAHAAQRSKLTADQVRAIRAAYGTGQSQQRLADQYGVSQKLVSKIVREASHRLGEPAGPVVSTSKYRHRLDPETRAAIVAAHLGGKSQAEVAELFGITQPRVSQLVRSARI